MESALVRIRFKPLLKNIQRDGSEHSLEIVPEVACIQNLEKIEWKDVENCIEYSIPMTYKIIFRRKRMNVHEGTPKIYHSCVDLLLRPSEANFMKLGSGDVCRSDTFVLSKVTTDVERCSIIFKDFNCDTLNVNVQYKDAHIQTGDNSIFKLLRDKEIDKDKRDKSTTIEFPAKEVENLKSSFNQTSHKPNNYSRCIDGIINAGQYYSETDHLKFNARLYNESKAEVERDNLTQIKPLRNDDIIVNALKNDQSLFVFQAYDNDFNNFMREKTYATMLNNVKYDFDDFKYLNNPFKKNFKSLRGRPEERVAFFVKQIEKEISPLRVMLNVLVNKCSLLGFALKKTKENSLLGHGNVRDENLINCRKIINRTSSNRVVYKIVFDG